METLECIMLVVTGGIVGAATVVGIDIIRAVRAARKVVPDEEAYTEYSCSPDILSVAGSRTFGLVKQLKHEELDRKILALETERKALERLQNDGRDDILKEFRERYCCSGIQCNWCKTNEEEKKDV